MSDERGLIFDIQGFSVHDGPGCRTLVFLKGCPLRCRWCANPEGIHPHPQVMYYRDRCLMSYACRDACASRAIHVEREGGSITIARAKCDRCIDFECADACDYDALKVSGYYMTLEELMEKIQKDRQYWGPGGGVTLSGGEPMLQHEFAGAVLRQCYDSYIHTGMETSGHAPWKHYEQVLGYVEWIFFDLKHMDPEMHKLGTGVSNELILDNARKIASLGECRLIFRMPVIPGFNDSHENIVATAEFISSIGKREINILPMHHLGWSKYELLGMEYPYQDLRKSTPEELREIRAIFAQYSIDCYIGSDTPF